MPEGDDQTLNGAPPHFIVVVPGYMGSQLRDKNTGEIVWIDFTSLPANPLRWDDWIDNLFDKMEYPNPDLEAAGIVEDVLFLPPWVKQEQYGRLLVALEELGYKVDPERYPESERDVYTFPYDWRQDNRISGRQLGEAIQHWQSFHPGAKAWLIGHSNGGIISRWYIEKEGGADHVGKLILMGSPWDGAPKGMRVIFSGLDTLFRRKFNLFDIPRRTRALIRTFPSAYHLIPVADPFLRDAENNTVDPFSNTAWLDNDEQRRFLEDGKRFNQELGTNLSVETLCFFGRKLPTQTYGVVRFEAGGRWKDIEWFATEAGDGTVPERSAVHPNADEKLPFVVGHGDIYINPAVLEFLQWELVDKYRGLRALLATPDISVLFEPEHDEYAPGETIRLSAQVFGAQKPDGERDPLEGASIEAQIEWQSPLPGDEPPATPEPAALVRLSPGSEPGRYQGDLQAPGHEGYYQLTAVVRAGAHPPVSLTELVLVEAETS